MDLHKPQFFEKHSTHNISKLLFTLYDINHIQIKNSLHKSIAKHTHNISDDASYVKSYCSILGAPLH